MPNASVTLPGRSMGAGLPGAESHTAVLYSQNIVADLPREHWQHLLSEAKLVHLPDGATLFRTGDPASGCYLLKQGILKVSVLSESGDERTLALLGPGSMVGELSLMLSLPRFATMQAVGECNLAFVSRAAFADALDRHPEIYPHLVTTLARRLWRADENAAAPTIPSARCRIARALLRLAEHLGRPAGAGRVALKHHVNHADIAAMAGVARESASRTLSDWRRKRIIQSSGSFKLVLDRVRLEREAQ